jgi:hypothetical protein
MLGWSGDSGSIASFPFTCLLASCHRLPPPLIVGPEESRNCAFPLRRRTFESTGNVAGMGHVSGRPVDGFAPGVNGVLGPGGHRHGAYATALAQYVHDHPPALVLLDMAILEPGDFGTAETAAEHDGQDCCIALYLDFGCARCVQQAVSIPNG